MRYQWLIFDADHTLFDFDRSEQAALLATLAAFGLPTDNDIHTAYQAINKPLWTRLEKGQITASQLKKYRTEELFAYLSARHPGSRTHIRRTNHDDFLRHYLDQLAATVRLMPAVADTLRQLAPHCQMVILTNGIHHMQQQRLCNSGLSGYFAHLLSSDLLGVAKPDARAFAHALEVLGNPPKNRVLMVGDKLETDILGARRAGIASCWFQPGTSTVANGNIKPTHHIRCFDQLLPLVLGENTTRISS